MLWPYGVVGWDGVADDCVVGCGDLVVVCDDAVVAGCDSDHWL